MGSHDRLYRLQNEKNEQVLVPAYNTVCVGVYSTREKHLVSWIMRHSTFNHTPPRNNDDIRL